MSQLLEEAIHQVRQLPQDEQDTIASLILAELADEERWNAAFANSQDQLAGIAENVRARIRAGRVGSTNLDQ